MSQSVNIQSSVNLDGICILLLLSTLNKKVSQIVIFGVLFVWVFGCCFCCYCCCCFVVVVVVVVFGGSRLFSSTEEISWDDSSRLLYSISHRFFTAPSSANSSDISFQRRPQWNGTQQNATQVHSCTRNLPVPVSSSCTQHDCLAFLIHCKVAWVSSFDHFTKTLPRPPLAPSHPSLHQSYNASPLVRSVGIVSVTEAGHGHWLASQSVRHDQVVRASQFVRWDQVVGASHVCQT